MKKFLLIILIIILTGCTNNEENTKNEYIAMKSNLIKEEIISYSADELPIEVTTNLDRINEEEISYKVTLTNPKENMHNIKAMIVHNHYSEEIFPSIGVFDETKELLSSDKNNEIQLTGTIKTTENISKMNLEIKLWLQYTDDSGEKKEIYYKTT